MRNNGKASEHAVQEALKAVNSPKFDWQRMYDATSARNAFMSQVGDFQWMMPGHHGVIEVKSTQHEYRLSKSAFSGNQLAKMRKRMNAGGSVYVFVHHYVADFWRLLPLQEILEAFGPNNQASMDLRQHNRYSTASDLLYEVIRIALSDSKH